MLASGHSGPVLTLSTDYAACASLSRPRLLVADSSVWATSLLAVAVRCVFCGFPPTLLCCPLRFWNSPQIPLWEGFPLFGNFSSFMTPSPGKVSIPNSSLSLSSIFCPAALQREWAAFLGAWCPPPAFRTCFVEVAQHSNNLLMSLWEKKWSYSSAILGLPPEYIICRCSSYSIGCIFILLCWGMFPLCPLCWEFLSNMDAEFCQKNLFCIFWDDHMIFFFSYLIWYILWPPDAKSIWKDPFV